MSFMSSLSSWWKGLSDETQSTVMCAALCLGSTGAVGALTIAGLWLSSAAVPVVATGVALVSHPLVSEKGAAVPVIGEPPLNLTDSSCNGWVGGYVTANANDTWGVLGLGLDLDPDWTSKAWEETIASNVTSNSGLNQTARCETGDLLKVACEVKDGRVACLYVSAVFGHGVDHVSYAGNSMSINRLGLIDTVEGAVNGAKPPKPPNNNPSTSSLSGFRLAATTFFAITCGGYCLERFRRQRNAIIAEKSASGSPQADEENYVRMD